MDMTYNYAAGQNNGRITSAVDGMAGETVNYRYDAVNRLASATATNGSWRQAFAYDGFGNLTQKTVTAGSAPTLSVGYDPATNHQVGAGYDGNGNQQVQGGVYNVENRLVQQTLGGLQYNYTYDPKGKRVIQASPIGTSTNWTQEISFYGIGGAEAGDGKLSAGQQWSAALRGAELSHVLRGEVDRGERGDGGDGSAGECAGEREWGAFLVLSVWGGEDVDGGWTG